ncbi:uncharacterized protein LOC129774624 [Toxorhynchites rutilus septentrionalis]|uniref:uncharacterized protein LOC129774624 n=1 Tax=Toxorhynchites rutilus septentrionalis TaxID=329112 RepID=UPI00247A9FEA|nr:uncharacterized protein LOC129774624 [Toxorhynchites rutilus septentrionalis]
MLLFPSFYFNLESILPCVEKKHSGDRAADYVNFVEIRMAASAKTSQGLRALFRRGWNEIPEVVGSSVMAVIGVGLTAIGLVRYYSNDMDNRVYKMDYVVMRPDDPRVARIRKD